MYLESKRHGFGWIIVKSLIVYCNLYSAFQLSSSLGEEYVFFFQSVKLPYMDKVHIVMNLYWKNHVPRYHIGKDITKISNYVALRPFGLYIGVISTTWIHQKYLSKFVFLKKMSVKCVLICIWCKILEESLKNHWIYCVYSTFFEHN